jgi:anti-anti-sigma factor
VNDLPFSEKDGFAIVHLPDHFGQNDWLAFRSLVNRQFIDNGRIHLIVDCEDNDDLPSIAFGSLTSLSRDFRRINGSLFLVHVSERIRMVLNRTRMDKILPIHGTMTEVFRKGERAGAALPKTAPST